MQIALYLLRHAESAPDPSLPEADWPLSPLGGTQAMALVPVLARLGITRIVSSPFLRAQRTVAPFAFWAGLEVEIDPDLRERKLAEGYAADWETLIRRAWADLSFCAGGGESGKECQHRIAECIQRWVVKVDPEHAPATTILFSSHGNAIGLYLNLLDPTFGYLGWQNMHNPDLFRLIVQDRLVFWDREFALAI